MKRIVREQIWSEFAELMDSKPGLGEEAFHRFMVKYPVLIPVWQPLENIVYSKFPLGSEFVTDFAFVRDDSEGLRWHFIEIENPRDRLLRKNGSPTAKLTQALSQLHNWHEWFQNNRAYVRQNFPHGNRITKIGLADPHLTLVIGRREIDWWDQRALLQRYGGGVTIRTFDSLERNLQAPGFDSILDMKCMAYSTTGWDKELSSMSMEISFYHSAAT